MTTNNQDLRTSGAISYDAQNLEQLRLQAKRDPDKAAGAAAKQFESLFVGMVLKSMREATPHDGPFDSEQTRMYTSMLDQQLAQHMSARGVGLAAALTRQLSPGAATASPADAGDAAAQLNALPQITDSTFLPKFRISTELAPTPESLTKAAGAKDAAPVATVPMPLQQTRDFVNRVWTHAVDAAKAIGIPARFMVGQAALESGWGTHEIRAADGTTSHNVFGIKAGRDWTGAVVEKTTTEYVNGVAQKVTAKFRAYASYSESFQDYAKLLRDNPRYAPVLAQAKDAKGFAHGLQKSGYATDPAYADKLTRIINGSTLRQSLIG